MGKIIQTYQGLTSSDLINRATDGVATMVASGSTAVNCTDIKMTGIKGSFGHPNANLGSLCNSSNVNIYSNFGPVEWAVNGSQYFPTHSVKYPYSMGNFAGYNHNALKPEITGKVERVAYTTSTPNISFYVDFVIGEINWAAFGAGYVKFIIRETVGQTILGSSVNQIDLSSGYVMNLSVDIENSGSWNSNKSLQGELYLCDSGGGLQSKIPNCDFWAIVGKYYTNGVTSTIDGATGTSTILVNGNYTLNFSVGGLVNVNCQIFNLFDELVNTETIAINTSQRTFSGTLSTPLSNGYYIRFNILLPE